MTAATTTQDETARTDRFTELLQASASAVISNELCRKNILRIYPEWVEPYAHPPFAQEFVRLLQANSANILPDGVMEARLRANFPEWFEDE